MLVKVSKRPESRNRGSHRDRLEKLGLGWPADLLEQLGVPAAEVAVMLVNGRPVDLQGNFLSNEDVVEIFPPIAGG